MYPRFFVFILLRQSTINFGCVCGSVHHFSFVVSSVIRVPCFYSQQSACQIGFVFGIVRHYWLCLLPRFPYLLVFFVSFWSMFCFPGSRTRHPAHQVLDSWRHACIFSFHCLLFFAFACVCLFCSSVDVTLFGSTYISSLAIQVATCLITRISLAPFTTAGLSPRSSPDYAAPLTVAESSVFSSR